MSRSQLERGYPHTIKRFRDKDPENLVRIRILDSDEDIPDRFEVALVGEGKVILSEARMKIRLQEMGIPEHVILLVRERLANYEKVFLNRRTFEHIT